MSSPQGPFVIDSMLDKFTLDPSELNCRMLIGTGCSPNTCIFKDSIPGLFRTRKGYRDGYILSETEKEYGVLLLHDEYGHSTYEMTTIQQENLVETKRMHDGEINIYVPEIPSSRGYFKCGGSLKGSAEICSGLYGTFKVSKRKPKECPIYIPLSLHDRQHILTLRYASSLLLKSVDEDLPVEVLDQVIWLINVVLAIDEYPMLSSEVIKEAIGNFVSDYTHFPKESQLRHPINYLMEILKIDGIWSELVPCVSFV